MAVRVVKWGPSEVVMRSACLTILFVLGSAIAIAQEEKLPPSAFLVDYYDGLRMWDLGEKEAAAGMWLEAANWGDRRSMKKLSELFQSGEVLPQDNILALFWLSIARKSDEQFASEVARLRARLPSDQLAQLDDAISKWVPKNIPATEIAAATASLSAAAVQTPTKLEPAALLAALEKNDILAFRRALEAGIPPTSTAPDGVPIILLASAVNDSAFVDALLSSKADLSVTLPNGMTPLHIAAGTGNRATVDTLISSGASPLIQDKNGVWPHEIAERKSFSELTHFLKARLETESQPLRIFLEKRGYLPENAFFDVAARDKAIRMYQSGKLGLTSTGILDIKTVDSLSDDAKADAHISYSYFVRYLKNDSFWYTTGSGQYATVMLARAAAMKLCQAKSGTECKFNFAPAGGCIAIARPSAGLEQFRVSSPQLDSAAANSDALAQCAGYSDKCAVVDTRCPLR